MSLNLDKSTWKRASFGDVIENVTDRVDNPSEAGVDRYVGLEHLDPGVLTVQRWDTPDKVEAQKLRFQSGDVIFGRRRAYQKKVALAEFEGICSAHALVLRPRRLRPSGLPAGLPVERLLPRPRHRYLGRLPLAYGQLARFEGPGVRSPAPRRAEARLRPPLGLGASSARHRRGCWRGPGHPAAADRIAASGAHFGSATRRCHHNPLGSFLRRLGCLSSPHRGRHSCAWDP